MGEKRIYLVPPIGTAHLQHPEHSEAACGLVVSGGHVLTIRKPRRPLCPTCLKASSTTGEGE